MSAVAVLRASDFAFWVSWVFGQFREAEGCLLGLCVCSFVLRWGILDGCRIAVVQRNFSEGGDLVNCEVGQEEFERSFVLSFFRPSVRRRLGRFGRVFFFGCRGWFELGLELRCSED